MRSNISTVAFCLSTIFASAMAQNTDLFPEPITIGQYLYPHGNQIVAWTPTKTTMLDACKPGNGTKTVLQVHETIPPTVPMCGREFELDGYSGLKLLCADGDSPAASQVTAVATNGTTTHNCTELPDVIYAVHCAKFSSDSIRQWFVCQ